jgi:hypothetical protein
VCCALRLNPSTAGFKTDQTTVDIGVLVGFYFFFVLLTLALFLLRLPRQRSSPGWRMWRRRGAQQAQPQPRSSESAAPSRKWTSPEGSKRPSHTGAN